jgi:nucleotide-binding universal stress UspA family protein
MTPTRQQMDRILCPVDFSDSTAPAVEHALRLARWFDARVEVLHVIPFNPFGIAGGGVPNILEAIQTQHEGATRNLATLVHPLLDEGVPIEWKVLDGDAWRVILEEAAAWPADLIVMGTHGRGGFEQLLLGSATEKVLRRATCPVLAVGHVVPPHPRKGPLFRRILCAADLSDASHGTLDAAFSLATENDARITLLHVVDSLPGEADARASIAVPEIAPLRVALTEWAHTLMSGAVPDTARRFCEVSERVETGTPWSEILRVAAEWDADLIVMGAHTRGAAGRMLFGSTASHVVRRARCPVLVVRETHKAVPPAGARKAAGRLSLV